MKLIIILIILLLIILYYNCINEDFYDFTNIPKEYNNINIVPVVGVPKIIHHICPKDFNRWHPKWFICYESWLRLYPKPEYEHMHWYDDELHKFIESDFPWFLEVFNSYDQNIKRIDMVRPFILYKYGGIYADMDYIAISNFYEDLSCDKVSICESPHKENEDITNALMASPIKNNFWLLVIDECYNHRDTYVLLSTGPQLITKIYHTNRDLVYVLPFTIYNPPPWDIKHDIIKAKHYNTSVW